MGGVGEGDKIIPLRFVHTNGLQSYESCVATYQIALRIIWMIIQIVAVMCIGGSGVHFLYQGF